MTIFIVVTIKYKMTYKIEIPELARTIEVREGENLKNVLESNGVRFHLHCGGKGKCGTCAVSITKGEIEQFVREKDLFGVQSNKRLACLHKVNTNLTLKIPGFSDHEYGKIISDFEFDSRHTGFSIAFDLGTTSIAGYLIDLEHGRILDYINRMNPQTTIGADVMTRLEEAKTEKGISELHLSVRETIRTMVNMLMERNSIKQDDLARLYIAGNTTMTHFFLGKAGEGLERAPYKSPLEGNGFLKFHDENNRPKYKIDGLMLPILSGFIGGDTTAAVIASDLDIAKGNRLLIDFGTNGEIVLSSGGKLCMTSTAAGPAFEGVGMSCGMPALEGAVEGFTADGNFRIIGNQGEIKGICGSGYISGISYLLQSGRMPSSGLLERDESGLRRWLIGHNNDRDIFIDQEDIRKFQLAKGAISAGIEIVCSEAEVSIDDLDEIILTGSFGNRIDKNSAVQTGLIPDIDQDKIIFMDNAAGRGAVLCSVSEDYMHRAEQLPSISQFINLGEHLDFQNVYVRNMLFP